MIDDELRPVVIEFIVEVLNDSRCESVLLDSDLPVLYLDVAGKYYGCTLNIVGGEYSVSIRDRGTNRTITTVDGGRGAWGLQELLNEIKTKLWEDK